MSIEFMTRTAYRQKPRARTGFSRSIQGDVSGLDVARTLGELVRAQQHAAQSSIPRGRPQGFDLTALGNAKRTGPDGFTFGISKRALQLAMNGFKAVSKANHAYDLIQTVLDATQTGKTEGSVPGGLSWTNFQPTLFCSGPPVNWQGPQGSFSGCLVLQAGGSPLGTPIGPGVNSFAIAHRRPVGASFRWQTRVRFNQNR